MLSHINKTCSSASYYLYNMRRIRKYLSHSVTESLVHGFITSRIDYCNSVLYGLPNSHIMKLQRIQNAAARLVTGTPRFCHVTPLLFHLHWLPIRCVHASASIIFHFSNKNRKMKCYLSLSYLHIVKYRQKYKKKTWSGKLRIFSFF